MRQYRETNSSLLYKSMTDLSLYNAGIEKCTPKFSYGPGIRQYTIIHFVLYGKGTLFIDDQSFPISKNQGFIIPSNKIAYYEADANDPWEYIWFGYLGINSTNYTFQIMDSLEQIYVFPELDVDKYYKLISKIIEVDNFSTSLYLKTNGLLLTLVSELFDDLNVVNTDEEKIPLVDEIKFYIDINYTEKLTVNELAKHFSIHPNYLSRLFSHKYKISPKKYILDLKIKKACDLLTSTNSPISIISDSLGFTDQLMFSKLFKSKMNMSPTKFRKTDKNTI